MTSNNIDYIDDCLEFLELEKDNKNDMAKTKARLKPEEIVKLKKSHDYWEKVALKAWSKKYNENKRKYHDDAFEYLL